MKISGGKMELGTILGTNMKKNPNQNKELLKGMHCKGTFSCHK